MDRQRVEFTQVIGIPDGYYSAWEPEHRDYGKHSTLTTLDGATYGRIGTRALPPAIEALGLGTDERWAAVKEWHRTQDEEAYALILAAYPEAQDGHRSDGEIWVNCSPFAATILTAQVNTLGLRGRQWTEAS